MQLQYDIVILGGGPAGVAAAVSARKFGAKVLLVERDGALGGMATNGLLNNYCGDADSRYFRHIKEQTEPLYLPAENNRKQYSPEWLKLVLLDDIEKAGAELLLHATLCGVQCGNGTISAVTVATKSGLIDVAGKTFIDCTGDGDLAALCGVPFDIGRDEDGLMQPLSTEFMLGGVDDEHAEFVSTPEIREKLARARKEGRMHDEVVAYIVLRGKDRGTAFVNMTNITHRDGSNVFDLTRAEIETRKQIPAIIRFLREEVRGFANCYLASTAAYVGVRESRRFRGLSQITGEDVRIGRVFEDRITNGVTYGFGVHDPTASKGNGGSRPPYEGLYYTIPYSATVPVGMNNLLLAGRCISGTHIALSSYRVIPICLAMGEGVGTCAAFALQKGLDACKLTLSDLAEVQNSIRSA